MRHLTWLIAATLVLTACASSPLDTSGVDNQATPAQAVGEMPGQQGTRVQWGGEIVEVTNHQDATLIEVLSYPLGRDGFPNIHRKPTGRFVLRRAGFLEPQDYAPGRLLTAVGIIRALTRTTVGQTQLVVPLVSAEQLKLWRDPYRDSPRSRFGFGVGVSIGL